MEYILKKIRPAKEDGFLILYVCPATEPDDTPKRLTLSERIYREGGAPTVGECIGEEVYDLFSRSIAERESVKAALELLGYSDKSEKEMRQRLVRRGFSAEIARMATEEAVRLGYLNERRALTSLVTERANRKLHGARRITAELCAKGYKAAMVHEVIRELCDRGEISFEDNFRALLAKKRVHEIGDATQKKEAIQKLSYQYGYK